MTYCNKYEVENIVVDKYTKTAWTIIAVGLFVLSDIGFKAFNQVKAKGILYA